MSLRVARMAGCACLLAYGLAACVSVQVQSILPPPEVPALTWTICHPGFVCLNDADGDQLSKFMDKLAAYRAAINRLQAP